MKTQSIAISVAIISFVLGLMSRYIVEPTSQILELRDYEIETTFPPTLCRLGQHNSLRGYLSDEGVKLTEPMIVTADDENAVILLHGRSLHVIKFTTFRFKLNEFGCRRL